MLLLAIKFLYFYRCINQLLIVRFDDADYFLSVALAHVHCVLIKYFVKFARE